MMIFFKGNAYDLAGCRSMRAEGTKLILSYPGGEDAEINFKYKEDPHTAIREIMLCKNRGFGWDIEFKEAEPKEVTDDIYPGRYPTLYVQPW